MDLKAHMEKAKTNEQFARWVEHQRPTSGDWCGTAYFYSALHLVDAYLHRYIGAKEYTSHKERLDDLHPRNSTRPLPDPQMIHYNSLYNLGRVARYQQVTVDIDHVQQIVSRHYEPLATFICHRLGIERP